VANNVIHYQQDTVYILATDTLTVHNLCRLSLCVCRLCIRHSRLPFCQ